MSSGFYRSHHHGIRLESRTDPAVDGSKNDEREKCRAKS